MNARKLNNADWLYIFSRMNEGYLQGQIHSTQGKKVISGWWMLTEKGIIIL